ncbi:MAG: MFS transporter [Anaerolineaceae bacterium]|nr:MFS transporter [Anaerolineaceae bacterium]
MVFLSLIRMFVNTNTRMFYPFLSVFARGLGVDLTSISVVMSARSFTAALSPFLAPVAEKRGRKAGILLGAGLFTIANALLIPWPSFPVFFLSQCVGFLGYRFFMATVHAYLSDNTPYQQRGRSIAIFEMGWSFSFILGVPLVGLLIGRYGWGSPFPVFTILGLITLLLLARLIPKGIENKKGVSLVDGFRQIRRSLPAIAVLASTISFHIANESVNLVFGVWLEDSFGLKIAALGAASLVIGLADLGGESLSATWVDRIGKKRAIFWGVLLNGSVALLLPWLGRSISGALVGLFFFYLTAEFAIVCFFPLISEILPAARATLLAYGATANSVGRGVGALLAPLLYSLGFRANALSTVFFCLLTLFVLNWVKVEDKQGNES